MYKIIKKSIKKVNHKKSIRIKRGNKKKTIRIKNKKNTFRKNNKKIGGLPLQYDQSESSILFPTKDELKEKSQDPFDSLDFTEGLTERERERNRIEVDDRNRAAITMQRFTRGRNARKETNALQNLRRIRANVYTIGKKKFLNVIDDYLSVIQERLFPLNTKNFIIRKPIKKN